MSERVLDLRDLNRATLDRQLLLARTDQSATEAVERLVGLQAQQALAPYVGLWTRVAGFDRDDLAGLIDDRQVVKTTFLRGTLHLTAATDYLRFRGTLQPALRAGWEAVIKRRGELPDLDAAVAATRKLLAEAPHPFADISTLLAERQPDVDIGSLRYGVRTHLPLVQVPTTTRWSFPGNPKFALADEWLGQPVPDDIDVGGLVLRYLAAFGPATMADFQTWSGLAVSPDELDALRLELRIYHDERGRDLFDLAELPEPDGGASAPVRLLPEYDNLLLSHKQRTRVVADAHRSSVFLPGLRVAATVLVDGFVQGTWKVAKAKGTATLTVEPFTDLKARDRKALLAEAEALVRFVEPDAKAHAVDLPRN